MSSIIENLTELKTLLAINKDTVPFFSLVPGRIVTLTGETINYKFAPLLPDEPGCLTVRMNPDQVANLITLASLDQHLMVRQSQDVIFTHSSLPTYTISLNHTFFSSPTSSRSTSPIRNMKLSPGSSPSTPTISTPPSFSPMPSMPPMPPMPSMPMFPTFDTLQKMNRVPRFRSPESALVGSNTAMAFMNAAMDLNNNFKLGRLDPPKIVDEKMEYDGWSREDIMNWGTDDGRDRRIGWI